MKIAFDYKIFYLQKYGGVSRYFTSLANELVQLEQTVKIFSPFYINKYLKDNVEHQYRVGKYIEEIPINTRKILFLYNRIASTFLINKWKPKIIHSTYYSENLIFNKNCSKVLTVYDLIHEIFYKTYNYTKNPYPKLKAIKNSDHIICPSYKTKKDLIDIYNVNKNKVSVIYMGVKDFSKEKKIFHTNNFKPYLLYVGDRKRYKNFINFIKGFSMNEKLNKYFKVVCFGGGKFSKQEKDLFLKCKMQENNIIQISGDDSVLSTLYKESKAFIFPSIYEGAGLPHLEAMTHGCPVITSNHEAIVEMVGDAAQIFDPNKIEDISYKIEDVVFSDEKSNELITKGLNHVKKFSWSKCASETLNLYNKLC